MKKKIICFVLSLVFTLNHSFAQIIVADFTVSEDTICEGGNVTFTDVSTGTISAWDWSFNGAISPGANTQGPHFNFFDNTGLFYVSLVVSNATNSDSIAYPIFVKPNPSVNAGNDTSICNGNSITLTADNPDGAIISWNNGVMDGVAFTPASDQTYTVTANLDGCSRSNAMDLSLQVCNPIQAIFSLSEDSICIGENITFTDMSIVNPDAWNWTFNGSPTPNANTQGPHNITFNTIGTHNITLTAFDGPGSDDTTIQIFVNPTPTINAGMDVTVCNGDAITLSAQNPDGANLSWDNSVNDGIAFTPSTSGLYTVTASLNGCSSSDGVLVVLNSLDTTIFNDTFCPGSNYVLPDGTVVTASGTYSNSFIGSNTCDSTVIINLTSVVTSSFDSLENISVCSSFGLVLDANTTNMTSIEWFIDEGAGYVSLVGNPNYSGANTDELVISLDTSLNNNMYQIRMINDCNSPVSSEMTLLVFTPSALENPMNDTTFCSHTNNLFRPPYLGNNFMWSTGDAGPFITPTETGLYTVSFTEEFTNCLQTDDINITIEDCLSDCKLNFPTGFSPNSNGINDNFKMFSNCRENISKFELKIFDQWGGQIFETTDIDFIWDGTFKSTKVQIGVYSYIYSYSIAEINFTETNSGNVTILK